MVAIRAKFPNSYNYLPKTVKANVISANDPVDFN